MTKHIHAELMKLYAEDAMETDKPWERWEHKISIGKNSSFAPITLFGMTTQNTAASPRPAVSGLSTGLLVGCSHGGQQGMCVRAMSGHGRSGRKLSVKRRIQTITTATTAAKGVSDE